MPRPFLTRAAAGIAGLCALFILIAGSNAQDKPKTLVIVPVTGPLKGKAVYAGSHALLIGINRYPGMPGKDLEYALNDVKAMAETLVKSYGFPPGNVRLLMDKDATLAGIRAALADLADNRKVAPEDRVLVYFSGHGQTVKLPGGGDMGFLIPHDAKVDLNDFNNAGPYLSTCLPMETVWGFLGPSPAKHVLVVADACYSGLLTNARGREAISEQTLAQLSATRARQVMTAGGKGQISLELAQVGHGAFTGKLLERLKARATEDDVFTASELYADVKVAVGNLSRGKQLPSMGSYDTEGEFLFIPVAWTGPKVSAQELIANSGKVSAQPAEPSKPARTRMVKKLEIIQPEGWKYTAPYSNLGRLVPEEYSGVASRADYLSLEIWDHADLTRATFSQYFQDFVEKQLAKQAILNEGKSESGKTKAGLDMLGRTTYVEENGKKTYYFYAGLGFDKDMYMAKVNYSSPEVFAQWKGDVEMILQTAKLPGAQPEPPASNLPRHRLYDIEITLPDGWVYTVEASGLASIVNKELKEDGDPNEFCNIFLRMMTGRWERTHPTYEASFRADVERTLKPDRILEGSDSSYVKGKTGRGLESITRRAIYKYTSRENMHWDHIGLWKDKSAAEISMKYSNKETYKKLEKDVAFILNTIRFWQQAEK